MSNNDPDGSQHTIVERMEELRELFTSRRNPLYAWKAILYAQAFEIALPEWCLHYIKCCAARIYGLTRDVIGHDWQQIVHANGEPHTAAVLDPEKAMRKLAAALEFPGNGRNSFAELKKDVALREDAALSEIADEGLWGITRRDAVEAVRKRRRLDSERSAKRRIKEGTSLL